MKLYITYEDKGPSGPCGQDMRTTAHWKRLYILEGTYEAIKSKLEEMESSFYKGRKSPKFMNCYWEETNDDEYGMGNDVYYVQT